MTDPYLLLTPLFALAVLALARFVGCDLIFELRDPIAPPTEVVAVPNDRRVDLTWTYPEGKASEFRVYFSEIETDLDGNPEEITVDPAATGSAHGGSVMELTNGTQYFFRVKALVGEELSSRSETVSATPTGVPFVLTKTLGTLRNDFQGWVGMVIEVGATPIRMTQLGRIVVPGNIGTHAVKIVDVGAGNVDLGEVNIAMPAAPSGEFAYVSLDPPVDLLPFRQYFVVSHEDAGGDAWHNIDTTVTTTSVARVLSGVFNPDTNPNFTVLGGPNEVFGPVDFVS